jgi:hypothetical protein
LGVSVAEIESALEACETSRRREKFDLSGKTTLVFTQPARVVVLMDVVDGGFS